MATAIESKVLRTREDVKAAIAESLIADSFWESIGIDPNAHFHDLSDVQVAAASEAMIENCRVLFIEANSETVPALYGLREVMPGEAPWKKINGKGLIAENNATNRMLNQGRADDLQQSMAAGTFATGPTFAIGSNGQFINGGTRGAGLVGQLEKDPNYKVVIRVEVGIPPMLRNLWDWKNREKKPFDLLFQDPAFMSADVYNYGYDGETIAPLAEEIEPTQVPKLRDKLCREYTSFAGFSLMRMAGKHVHSHAADLDVMRFDTRFEDRDSQRLVYEVYRRRLGGDDKELGTLKRLPTSQLACALLLASNRTNEDVTQLSVDWELVERVMTALASSTEATGDFSLLLSKLAAAFKNPKTKLPRKGVFDAIVDAVRQFVDTGKVSVDPIPTVTDLKKKTYPTFGGIDIGYQEKVAE